MADRPGNSELELTAALPGFYCKNKKHRPAYVPFQRVNDGICDYELCCDGSDEWAHVGGTKCENRCKEIGKAWRKQEEERHKSMTAALKNKKELLVDAGRQQKEIENHIMRLEVELKAEELKVNGLEKDLEEIQKEEQKKAVGRKRKGKINTLAQLAKGRVEELRNALVEVRQERDEIRGRVKELEEILSKFKVEYNPNFNDEGVKRAVRSWEEYAARQAVDGEAVAGHEQDLDAISAADSEQSGINWEQWENEEDGCENGECRSTFTTSIFRILTTILAVKLTAFLPPPVASYVEDKIQSIKGFLETNGILPQKDYDASSESTAVTEARNALKSAQDTLEGIQRSLRDHRADLETEYGPASIFRALKGKCISKDSGEYTYEHCFLEKTKQIPKKSGSSVTMGNFVGIGKVDVDEVNESGEIIQVPKTSLEYANGQTCWNGPARSTTVILECGENNEILKVMEDEKCVYSMIATTPAVCEGGEAEGNVAPRKKDEL